MERRRLNFDAPILSTRKHSLPSTPTKQVRLNEVQNPLGVRQEPDRWKKSEQENDKVATPGTVPFLWEKSPGRPKNKGESSGCTSGSSRYDLEERFYDHNTHQPQTDSYSLSDCDVPLEKFKKTVSCRDEPHSECGDGERSDGAEALSQSESGGVNYSTSGLSTTVKSSGAFKVDEKTRDFLMRRFLPAAKAAVLETPEDDEQPKQVRKSKVLHEQLEEVRKEVFEEPVPFHYGYSPSPLLDQRHPGPYPCHSKLIDHMESQAAIKKCSVPFKKQWKVIPRLFTKKLRLLKPRLGSKLRSLTPPPTSEVKRLARKALSGPLDKSAFHQYLKKKFQSGFLSRELQGGEESTQFGNNPDSIHLKLSPMRRYSNGISSPYRNEGPKSPFRDFQSANATLFKNDVTKSHVWDASPYRTEAPKSPLRGFGTASTSTYYLDELRRSLIMDYQSANVSPFRNEPLKSTLRANQSAKSYPHQDEPSRSSFLPKSPLRHCESVNSSPVREGTHYQREFCPVSEKADNHKTRRFARSHELYRPLQDVRWNRMHELPSSVPLGSSSPMADAKEKTLYVDTINLPLPKTSYTRSGLLVNFADNHNAGTKQKERNAVKYDTSPDWSDSDEVEKSIPKLGSTENVEYSSETFAPDTFYFADSKEDTNSNQGRDQPLRTLQCISEVKRDNDKERDLRSPIRGSDYPAKIHMPPQLPKMPSQSWLSQATESAATGRYTSPQSRRTIYSKLQGQKGSNPDPKWEFALKTSDALGRDHRRYSEELPPSYQRSKPYQV